MNGGVSKIIKSASPDIVFDFVRIDLSMAALWCRCPRLAYSPRSGFSSVPPPISDTSGDRDAPYSCIISCDVRRRSTVSVSTKCETDHAGPGHGVEGAGVNFDIANSGVATLDGFFAVFRGSASRGISTRGTKNGILSPHPSLTIPCAREIYVRTTGSKPVPVDFLAKHPTYVNSVWGKKKSRLPGRVCKTRYLTTTSSPLVLLKKTLTKTSFLLLPL